MLVLENFKECHLENTFKWMQDQHLRELFLLRRTISKDEHLAWFNSLENDSKQKICAILYDGKHVGNVGLKNINTLDSTAEIWIYVGELIDRKKGLAKAACEEFLKSLPFPCRKIYCHVADFNIGSLRLFQSLDFKIEGIFFDEILLNNKYSNLIRLYKFL